MRRSAALTRLDLWSSSAITANSGEEFAMEMHDGAGSTATFPPSMPAHPVMNGTSVAASRMRLSGSTPPTGCVTPSSASASVSFRETAGPGCGWATSRRGEDSRSSGRGKQDPSAPDLSASGPDAMRARMQNRRPDGRREGRLEGRLEERLDESSRRPRTEANASDRKRGTRWAQPRSRRAFRATNGC